MAAGRRQAGIHSRPVHRAIRDALRPQVWPRAPSSPLPPDNWLAHLRVPRPLTRTIGPARAGQKPPAAALLLDQDFNDDRARSAKLGTTTRRLTSPFWN